MSPAPVEPARLTLPVVEVNGSVIDARLAEDLLEMRVVRGTRSTGRATLTFVDRTFTVASSNFSIGAALRLTAVEPRTVIFEGVITAVTAEIDGEGARATVTAHDPTYALAHQRGAQAFLDMRVDQALTEVLSGEGFQAEGVPTTGARHHWLWRSDSVLGFVDEVCERHGWEWVYEGGKTLRFVDVSGLVVPATSATLTYGEELWRFALERSGTGAGKVTVRGWDPVRKEKVEATATRPKEKAAIAAGSTTPPEQVAAHVAVSDREEATAVAKALAAGQATLTARGRATFAPRLVPGSGVEVKGAGPSSGTYYVREVEHVYDGGPLRTSFVAGFRPPTLLSDPYGAAGVGSSVRASGVRTGVVTKVAEDPDNIGRVRVALKSLDETVELGWARVLALGAGNGYGLQVMPRVGDEVLIAFEDDDVRRPVVVGGLYNQRDTAPFTYGQDDATQQSVLLTPKGHGLVVTDSTKRENALRLTVAGAAHLHLGEEQVELVSEEKPITVTVGQSTLVLDQDGTITLKGSTVKIEAKSDFEVHAGNVKIKADVGVEVQGTTTAVKASSNLRLQSSAVTEVSGSMVRIN